MPWVSPWVAPQRQNAEGPPWKIISFSIFLITGLIISQVAVAMMDDHAKHVWEEVVGCITMCCLAFIMVGVGYEFDIDKSNLRSYGQDMIMACGAAGLPWFVIAIYFMACFPQKMSWPEALLAARFAAPTSAGILFSMLEAAGLKATWLFQKARILAIFDDLDTILLMIPLKALVVGFKWELLLELVWILALLALAWWKFHAFRLPHSWHWTVLYAVVITSFTETVHFLTYHHIPMETVHLEVLLPAFVLGCLIHVEEEEESAGINAAGPADSADSRASTHYFTEERIKTAISTGFMFFVGLSMPSLFGGTQGEQLGVGDLLGHVVAVSLLMILGKMFLCCFYRDEVDLRVRVALGLGMCPRGEVGAGVIVISISLGISGPVVTVSVACLVLNLLLSSGFIMGVRYLARSSASTMIAKTAPAEDERPSMNTNVFSPAMMVS